MVPKPGDVVLYPVTGRSGWTSRAVAIGELLVGAGRKPTLYSHAAILAWEPGWQYEAKWPRTGRFRIDRARPYEIWNVGNPSDGQRRDILNWAAEHCGQWYNMLGLLTGGLLGLPGHVVCSQFVGLAYAAARPGIRMSKEGLRLLSPDAIPDHRDAALVERYPKPGRGHCV